MESPFTVKVGQVFTGVGIGCGVGVGIGTPIPFGSIPALQQVMSATRGATDPFFAGARYLNGYMKKMGIQKIEAGVGCGVGVGHGFGVGLALKPRVVHQVQSSIGQAVAKVMTHLGIAPGLSPVKTYIQGDVPSSTVMQSGASDRNVQASTGNMFDLMSEARGSTFQHSKNYESSNRKPIESYEMKKSATDLSSGTRTEKVINSFLQSPLFENEEMEISGPAGNLRLENNLLQLLLKNQQAIGELMEENKKLRQILVEDLKVSPSKFQERSGSATGSNYTCSDCFECRRRRRRSAR